MGDIFSTPSQSNPSTPTPTPTPTMASSSNPPQTHQPKPGFEPAHQPENPESKTPDPISDAKVQENTAAAEEPIKDDGDGEGEEEEEEEGECGFCLFMKGGGCKDTFVEWEKCVEEGEKNKEDIVEKCYQATADLKKCMEAHSDYYAPLLAAEKAAEEEAARQLEEGRENFSDQDGKGEASSDSEHKEKSS